MHTKDHQELQLKLIWLCHEWLNLRNGDIFSFPTPLLRLFLPAIYPGHVWHMAATDSHASIMLDPVVLERREGVMFTVCAHGIQPRRCFCIRREGVDERCQCPLSDHPTSSFNSRKREAVRGWELYSGAVFCGGFNNETVGMKSENVKKKKKPPKKQKKTVASHACGIEKEDAQETSGFGAWHEWNWCLQAVCVKWSVCMCVCMFKPGKHTFK